LGRQGGHTKRVQGKFHGRNFSQKVGKREKITLMGKKKGVDEKSFPHWKLKKFPLESKTAWTITIWEWA